MAESRPTSRSGLMSDEDRKLVDIFMAANATPQGRMFSVAILAGIKAVIAADRAAANAPASETQPSEVERLKEALRLVKSWVVGEKSPNWHDDTTVYLTRGKIADICDIAIAHPNHPRDMHLTVEKR